MAITASQVKELRERTGAGMMDCKKALTAEKKACPRRLRKPAALLLKVLLISIWTKQTKWLLS